ncbi:MAG TPA: hypothetical protein PLL26_00770 [Candidatus Dojkabacteria bacterium]|nr:hypothetical protein [Candidatus Dojkabacteria bacterium]
MVSTDPFNPVKVTVRGGSMIETDCSVKPDPRVRAVMKMWIAISGYIGSVSTTDEYSAKKSGRSMDLEQAKKMAEYAKTLGDKDMEVIAQTLLKHAEANAVRDKSYTQSRADTATQQKEAEEMLKFAEESKDEDMIMAAKAQVAAASGSAPDIGADIGPDQVIAQSQMLYERLRADVEVDLPPYAPTA